MKTRLLSLLVIPGIAFAADNTVFDNNTWYLDNNTLTTNRHDPFTINGRVYDHSLSYATPSGGHGSSDACALSSPTSLSCYSGDNVTYNAETHSVTLSARYNGTYTYYEKDYVPAGSPLSGNWRREQKVTDHCRDAGLDSMVIPYHDKDTKTFKNVDRYFSSGYSKGNTYYLVKNKMDGRIALSPIPDDTYYNSFYLYDASNNPIYDFDKIGTLVKLNDGRKTEPECNMVKTK